MQEALVRAWSGREACRSPEAPLPWVLEITRNETRRVLGRQARRSTREVVGAELPLTDDDDRDLSGAALRLTMQDALRASAIGTARC